MKILIADNQNIIQASVNKVLNSLSKDAVIEFVTDGNSAMSKVKNDPYDLVILGDAIPGIGGLDILEKMKAKSNHSKVIIFSEYPKEQCALKAFKLGAVGYLSKFSALNVLNLALRDIVLGDGYELIPYDYSSPTETAC